MRSIRLTIANRLENVGLIGESVHKMCESNGFSSLDSGQIELGVVEAVTNCVEHAYEGQTGCEIEVTVLLDERGVEIVIFDTGNAAPDYSPPVFDFDPNDLDALPEHGMGLHLIHSIMTRVSYESRGGRNRLVLLKELPPEEPEIRDAS